MLLKMCGRYIIDDSDDIKDIRNIFEKLQKYYSETVEIHHVKRGEIFPNDMAPIIIPEKGERIDVIPMRWGIRQNFTNTGNNSFNNRYNNNNLVINARSEGIYQKRMFRDSIENKRCIIPANGFFEWAKLENKKEKYLIQPAYASMLYFAGVYEKRPDPKFPGEDQIRFVIITTEARGLIRSLHSRMPVAVERKDMLKWLNGNSGDVNEFFTDTRTPEYIFTNLSAAG